MPQGRELFQSAEASLAAYIDLIPGSSGTVDNTALFLTPIPIPLLPDGEPAFTEASRARFTEDFSDVLTRTEHEASGFGATVFLGQQNQVAIGFRGTEHWLVDFDDINADTQLLSRGAAFDQIVAMYNWWQRVSVAPGTDPQNPVLVPQYRFTIEETQDRPDPDPAIFLGFNTTAETTAAYLYPEPSMPVYTEQEGNIAARLLAANGNVIVTGHSLGAHLAVAFATLFPTVISDAYGFNTPGFKNNSMIDNFFNALGSTSGGPDAANTGNVTNIFAKEVIAGEQEYNWVAGLHFGENPLGYTEIPIEDQNSTGEPAEESNHSIKILTDSLAVYEVLTKIDPALDVERYYDIFQQAANTPHKALEAMVDSLSALLGIDAEPLPVGNGNREALYDRLAALHNAIGTESAGPGLVQFLAEQSVRESAVRDFGKYLTLHFATPFVVSSFDSTLEGMHGANGLFAGWKAGSFSAQYLADRELLRYALDQRNTEDEAFPDEVAGSRVRFVDSVLGEVFAGGNSDGLEGTNTVDPNTVRNVLFGSNSEGDIQYGLQHHDTLYGMGGADQQALNSRNFT